MSLIICNSNGESLAITAETLTEQVRRLGLETQTSAAARELVASLDALAADRNNPDKVTRYRNARSQVVALVGVPDNDSNPEPDSSAKPAHAIRKCTKCGASMVFLFGYSGPINADTVKPGDTAWNPAAGHVSHFATCPYADNFRKGKK